MPFARGCRVGVWFGFVGAALLPAVGSCVVLAFGAVPGRCCFLRVTQLACPCSNPHRDSHKHTLHQIKQFRRWWKRSNPSAACETPPAATPPPNGPPALHNRPPLVPYTVGYIPGRLRSEAPGSHLSTSASAVPSTLHSTPPMCPLQPQQRRPPPRAWPQPDTPRPPLPVLPPQQRLTSRSLQSLRPRDPQRSDLPLYLCG